jgi:hypothetical protein
MKDFSDQNRFFQLAMRVAAAGTSSVLDVPFATPGFSQNGDPKNGWFIVENLIEMDENWGYLNFCTEKAKVSWVYRNIPSFGGWKRYCFLG